MKDHIGGIVKQCTEFQEVKTIVDDYMDYYNNEEYVWELCMLSPNEYYDFVTTGVYPLAIENPPQVPEIQKSPEELGKKAANIKSRSPSVCKGLRDFGFLRMGGGVTRSQRWYAQRK